MKQSILVFAVLISALICVSFPHCHIENHSVMLTEHHSCGFCLPAYRISDNVFKTKKVVFSIEKNSFLDNSSHHMAEVVTAFFCRRAPPV